MAPRFQKYLTPSAKKKIAIEFAKKSGGVAGKATRLVSKVAVPLAVGYEAYNTGKKVTEFVKGYKAHTKDISKWSEQSNKTSDELRELVKSRRKSHQTIARGYK